MRTYSPLFLLGALGVLSAASLSAAAADTSQWKCESCPFPTGITGSLDAGLGAVSDASGKFGDFTGLQRDGAHLILGGEISRRGDDGYYADASASDLGLDTRSLSAQTGREGLYGLKLGYSQIPRHFTDGAQTPFLGIGSANLSLPAGFVPAGSSDTMNLAGTLHPVDLGFKRSRFEAGATWIASRNWTYKLSLQHDVREGTLPVYGSFYAVSTQLAAPVDQVTDQIEISTAYTSRRLQASLGYQVSRFRNDYRALNWTSAFSQGAPTVTTGQIALAPDNQMHQIVGSAGYEVMRGVRASADFAAGRMTQDAPFLATGMPAMPGTTLDGHVDTFNGSARISATPFERLRLNASYVRNVHNNKTALKDYPVTDVFMSTVMRSNVRFSFKQEQVKASADYRGPGSLKLSAGAEQDDRQRTFQEVVNTRETSVWGRVAVQPMDALGLTLKVGHSQRNNSPYGTSIWFSSPENPLLRKYNLADRRRDTAGARADITFSESVGLGLSLDYANDDYRQSAVGLTGARSASAGADLSWAITDKTRLQLFAQGERIRSQQAGSELFGQPDWSARNKDSFEVVGLGIKHTAIPDKLDIGADLAFSRSNSDVTVASGSAAPAFPTATTRQDSLKLYATYKLKDNLSLTGSFWHEKYDAQDWRLDGILPATVSNLLSFGQQAPHYSVNLLRVSMRYKF